MEMRLREAWSPMANTLLMLEAYRNVSPCKQEDYTLIFCRPLVHKSLLQYLPLGRDCVHLPWYELAARSESILGGVLDTAAARNLHADDGYALDIVVGYYLCELFGVVGIVKLRTSDYSDMVFYKTLMEIAVSVCGTVGCYEKISIVKVWGAYGNKLNLYRPL